MKIFFFSNQFKFLEEQYFLKNFYDLCGNSEILLSTKVILMNLYYYLQILKDIVIVNDKWNEKTSNFWKFYDKNLEFSEKSENSTENFEKNKNFM